MEANQVHQSYEPKILMAKVGRAVISQFRIQLSFMHVDISDHTFAYEHFLNVVMVVPLAIPGLSGLKRLYRMLTGTG